MSYADNLLDDLLNSYRPGNSPESLRDLWEDRIAALEISQRQALLILDIEVRTLNALLDGKVTKIDFILIQKLSQFLNLSPEEIVIKYLDSISLITKKETEHTERRNFIVNNFDLVNLKRCKIIDTVSDFDRIEKQINKFFGYSSIYEFKKDRVVPAFSVGKTIPKNPGMRDFWIESAYRQLRKINNPYHYERQNLINYFPTIRWHSMNVTSGLLQVTRSLFKLGITLIYQPYLPTVHARGATFCVNDKPCIVLTDYKGFYPTLWWALIHELHHVLFDWDEIKVNSYHLSGEPDLFTMKEEEANKFARDYLFSDKKMQEVIPHINNEYFVEEFAKSNHVHPSIIYIFYCYDAAEKDKNVWGKYKRFMPDIQTCLKPLGSNPWQKSIPEMVKARQEKVFNTV